MNSQKPFEITYQLNNTIFKIRLTINWSQSVEETNYR